jgi:hypothetical protein
LQEFLGFFFEGDKPKRAGRPVQMRLFIRLVAMLPLRWVTLAIAALCLVSIAYFVKAELRSENFDVTCKLRPPQTSFIYERDALETVSDSRPTSVVPFRFTTLMTKAVLYARASTDLQQKESTIESHGGMVKFPG